MLSRARFDDENCMVSEDDEVGIDFFEAAHLTMERVSAPTLNEFDESEYDGEWLQIGRFLKTMMTATEWTRKEANWIQKKAYRFFLRDGRRWRHLKKRNGLPL
jgi:lipocalin